MNKKITILGREHDLDNPNGRSDLAERRVDEYFTGSYYDPSRIRQYVVVKDNDNLDCSTDEGRDLFSNNRLFYSAKKEEIFILKDYNNSFAIIAQEFWDGIGNTPCQDRLLKILKEEDRCGFKNMDQHGLYKIFIPQEQFKNLVGTLQPNITSPDSIQAIGDALLKNVAGTGEFQINFIQ